MAAAAAGNEQSGDGKVVVDLSQPRFDQGTFWGRLRHFSDITDVRNIGTTSDQLKDAVQILENYTQAGSPPVSPQEAQELWAAKKRRDAILHPQTGEPIPIPFRISSFVPMNMGIVAGMLIPNPSMPTLVFWQWLNQSYNIALNHSNRNASNEMSNEQIAVSYASAVAISCSLAVGLSQWVKRKQFQSATVRAVVGRAIPFTATASAGVANVVLMRKNEATEGIEVHAENGAALGTSRKAGQIALATTSVSRIATSVAALVAPALVIAGVEKVGLMPRSAVFAFGTNVFVVGGVLLVGLPITIAIFPQHLKVPPAWLEPEFAAKRDARGKPYEHIVVNKGI